MPASPVLIAALRSLYSPTWHRQMRDALVASPAVHSHRSRARNERPDAERRAEEPILSRGSHRLPAPQRAGHRALGLFLRFAARSVGRDAARVDVRPRRRPRHYRPPVTRRASVHAKVHLGAGGRRLARTLAVGAPRTPPRL